jgi:hypothetical protein
MTGKKHKLRAQLAHEKTGVFFKSVFVAAVLNHERKTPFGQFLI